MKKYGLFLLLAVFIAAFASCDLKIPVKKMTRAKELISQAEKYDANKYASAELKAAKKFLEMSHTDVAEKNVDKAEVNATDARDKAKEAIAKSLPKWSLAEVQEAKKQFQIADGLFASQLAPNSYKVAVANINNAAKQYNQKEYLPAYESASKAKEAALQAQKQAEANIPKLKNQAQSLKTTIENAKKIKSAQAYMQKLDTAGQTVDNSITLMDEKKVKEGYLELQKANKILIGILPNMAASAIQKANVAVSEAQKVSAGQFAQGSVSQAASSLNQAKSLNSQKKFVDATLKAEEAEELALKAKEEALGQKPDLMSKIAELKEALKQHKLQGGDEYAPNEMNVMTQTLTIAENSLNKNEISPAMDNIKKAEAAKEIADAKAKKYIVLKKIQTAIETYSTVTANEEIVKNYPQDIKEIATTIKAAKAAYNGNDLNTAEVKADESLKMLDELQLAYDQNKDKFETVEPTPTPEEVVIETPEKDEDGFPKEYTVVLNKTNRDSLWKIAKKFYNKAQLWPLIYAANKDQIKNPDLIFPGQKFVIPSKNKMAQDKKEVENSSTQTPDVK